MSVCLSVCLTAFIGGAACLVGAGYVGCEHRAIAVVLLAVAVGFEGLSYSGFIVNHIDFAPRLVGVCCLCYCL